ncbi:MAG TPA: hypothetical protein VFV95_02375 [Vicinamibacterales bacterium]|nr:hypothetical protein [Vicinamibacterales bacterium]
MTTIDPGRSDMHQILNPRGTDAPTDPTPPAEELDFSLILGGPIYQIFVRSHLSGNGLELLNRRIVVISALAWLPLLVLSIISGHFMSGSALPFLRDVEAHARLLVALPVLIMAEVVVHTRIRSVANAFLTRRIVVREDVPRFVAAVQSAMKLRNSVPMELGLLVLVFTVGVWLWRSQIALGSVTWYAAVENGQLQLTLPGYWYAFVSIPVFQFILLRWYFRLFIWFRFLWQVSKLNLHIVATHPDRAGALGFLGRSAYAYSPILFAQGTLLSGFIANRVLYGGELLSSFRVEAGVLIGFFLVVVLGPLVMFTPKLAQAKRQGLAKYGVLASRYVEQFERKWVGGGAAGGDELLGSGDIQSLADLGNAYTVVSEMRAIPFRLSDAIRLAGATAAPLVPLGLIVLSFEELVAQLVKILL